MDSRLTQRLIGAAVLIALAVIFLPMLVKGPAPDSGVSDLSLRVPDAPADAGTIDLPLIEDESAPIPTRTDAAEAASTPGQGAEAAPAAQGAAAAAEPADADSMLPASVASGQYVVHYASFATQTEADQMVRQLQARELPAFTQPATFNDRPAVAVRIGPYPGRADAETIRVRAAQVRTDVKPLVLALDADPAQPPPQPTATAAAAPPPRSSPTSAASARLAPTTPARVQPSNPARAASAAPAAATGFVVQIGAFSKAASATNLRNRLRAANIPAFTDTLNTSRGRLTRVNAGPVSSRTEADQLQIRVKSAVGMDGIVRSHP